MPRDYKGESLLEGRKGEVTIMQWEKIEKDIQKCIEEEIKLELYELRGNGEPQYRVVKINEEVVDEEDIVLVNLKRTNSYMSSRSYIPLDLSNYHGLLEIYYCKKKKGLFGKDSLKTINSFRKGYHIDALENGEEQIVSLKELMKK